MAAQKVTHEDIEDMAQMYLYGFSSTRIAKLFQFDPSTVCMYLKRRGIELRPNGWQNGKGPNSVAWRGGKTRGKDKNYVAVWVSEDDPMASMKPKNTNYIPEHRLVMARHLGRPLTSDELVHHKNGITTDNELSNLELCLISQPPGQRVNDLRHWAKEILERYPEDV